MKRVSKYKSKVSQGKQIYGPGCCANSKRKTRY